VWFEACFMYESLHLLEMHLSFSPLQSLLSQ
jgi:hypothetical protein